VFSGKHNGRYYIYIPAAPDGRPWSIYSEVLPDPLDI